MDLAFGALGDPRRQEIMRLVWSEEMASSAIGGHFDDVSRCAISQHLGMLHREVVQARDSDDRIGIGPLLDAISWTNCVADFSTAI